MVSKFRGWGAGQNHRCTITRITQGECIMKASCLTAGTLAACAVLVIGAADASARGGMFGAFYGRSFSAPGWSHSATINRSPGEVSGTRSFETPNGSGATRTFDRGCANGTCTNTVTTTTNSGTTWSRSGSVSAPGNGSLSWNRSSTGPNGGTTARSGSCAFGSGCSATATATGPNGNTRSVQRSFSPNGQGGYNYSATFTGPNGSAGFSGTRGP